MSDFRLDHDIPTDRLRRDSVYLLLLTASLALVALHFIAVKLTNPNPVQQSFQALFDLNGEANIPTWFGSGLWLLAASCAFRLSAHDGSGAYVPAERPYWLAIALGCALLSADETAQFHETIGAFMDRAADDATGVVPVYRWTRAAFLILPLVAIPFAGFLFRLPRRVAVGLISSMAVFLAGAIGMETLGSLVESHRLPQFPLGLTWNRSIAIEEFLEMAGVILLIRVMRRYRLDCLRRQPSDPAI